MLMFILFLNKTMGLPAFPPSLSVGLNVGPHPKYVGCRLLGPFRCQCRPVIV